MPDAPLDLLRQRAQQLAQDAAAHGVSLLLAYPADYDQAAAQGLLLYNQDQPRLVVVDYVVPSEAWRFPLTGASPVAGSSYVEGSSLLQEVWAPYEVSPEALPLDADRWRVRRDPTAVMLELLDVALAAGETLRLVFTAPHSVTMSASTLTARGADVLALLVASLVLQLAANRAVQNTGSTGLPNDVVDRRSQSDLFRSRAKELRDQYQQLVGTRRGGGPVAASATQNLNVAPSTSLGFLWRRRS